MPALRFSGFLFGLLVTLLFMAFLYKTKFGIIIRATAQDRDTANLLGADVRKVGAFVYSLYAGVTGMSGVLIGALFSIHSAMGAKYTMLAFFVVVLAGMGYVPGVLVGCHCPRTSSVVCYRLYRRTFIPWPPSFWSCTECC